MKKKKMKVKKKKSFPDMSGDGKVTKKDILIARGVIKMSFFAMCPPIFFLTCLML